MTSTKQSGKILRVGIIGCGNIFQSHSQAYPDHPNAVIVGFYDRIKSRASAWLEKITELMKLVQLAAEESSNEEDRMHMERCKIFFKEVKVYDSVQGLLQAVDVVDVCAPNYAHTPYALWALQQGKSIMVEKPPARISLETAKILDLLNESPGIYQVNENFFWQSYVRDFRIPIKEGKIGKISEISVRLGHGSPSWGWQQHFLNPSLSGGGVLADMGIHAIGMVYTIIPHIFRIKSISTICMRSGSQKERVMRDSDGVNEYYLQKIMVEDEAQVVVWLEKDPDNIEMNSPKTSSKILEYAEFYDDQIKVTIEASWNKTYKDILVSGAKGTLELATDEINRKVIHFHPENGKMEVLTVTSQGRDSHQLEVIDFISRVAQKKQPLISPAIVHQMQSIISGAYFSFLKQHESKKAKPVPITIAELENYYRTLLDAGIPREILIEEIVYRFMSPFTDTYYDPNPEFLRKGNYPGES